MPRNERFSLPIPRILHDRSLRLFSVRIADLFRNYLNSILQRDTQTLPYSVYHVLIFIAKSTLYTLCTCPKCTILIFIGFPAERSPACIKYAVLQTNCGLVIVNDPNRFSFERLPPKLRMRRFPCSARSRKKIGFSLFFYCRSMDHKPLMF